MGWSLLSMATSARLGSKTDWDGTVISPRRKNPKKAVVHAAHSIIVSGSLLEDSHWRRIWRRMSGVIGSLIGEDLGPTD